MLWLTSVLLLLFSIVTESQSAGEGNTQPNTTAPVPTTKTTSPVPTTKSTTPSANTTVAPVPTVPVYFVRNETNICLILQTNLQLGITYFDKQGEPLIRNFYINSTEQYNVSSSGTCDPEMESLLLLWWLDGSAPAWALRFQFEKRSDGHFSLGLMEFNYTTTESLFPNTNETSFHRVSLNASQFTCPLGSYFKCMTQQTSKLTKSPSVHDQNVQPEVFITLSNLKVEAFRKSNSTMFVGSMRECSADYVPNKVVPIVVGIALAAMIVIALITFIIGSRRRQNGYQEI